MQEEMQAAHLDVLFAEHAQLGVEAEVGGARLHHLLYLHLAGRAEAGLLPVVLQAFLRTRIARRHVRAELLPSTHRAQPCPFSALIKS